MRETILYDSAMRLFGDQVTPRVLANAEKGMWPEALWQAVEEAGYPDVLLDGPAGMVEAVTILRAAGHHAAPIPLAETILARWLCAAAGMEPPPGASTIAPVEPGDRVIRIADTLAGRIARVPWARDAGAIVLLGEDRLHIARRRQFGVEMGRNLAGEPRDELDGVVTEEGCGGAALPGGIDAAALLRVGALLRAAQMAGAMAAALDLASRYANERIQFGRPIAKFQAVQQQLALLAEETAASQVVVESAAEAVALGRPSAVVAVPAAKIRTGISAGKVAEIAHQVHGAIGFTEEHSLHYLTRRLWSWRDEFGHESYWAQELGRHVAAAGPDGLWPLITML